MNEEKIFNLIFFEIFENQKAEDLKVCGVKYILEVICASESSEWNKMTDLTKFTERNPLLTVEAKNLLYNPLENRVGKNDSGHTDFYALGSFQSLTLAQDLYAGLKTRPKDKSLAFSRDQNIYFVSSLSNLILLDEICLQLTRLMPAFFGAVVKDDKFQGMLMEDYTNNGKDSVWDYRWPKATDFPEGFLEKTTVDPDDELDLDDLAHIFASTNDGLRIMDVNMIPWREEYEIRRGQIRDQLWNDPAYLRPYVLEI